MLLGKGLLMLRCVVDPSARGEYKKNHYTMSSIKGCAYEQWKRKGARCALANERIVFIGDSTMRQLFAAVACKLSGGPPKNLPKKSDNGYKLEWVVYKNFVGANDCEPEIRGPKGSTRFDSLRATWKVADTTMAFRWAENADDIAKIALEDHLPSFTTLVLNVGLHYPAKGTIPCPKIGDDIDDSVRLLLANPAFNSTRIFWIEQQALPPHNSRAFLTTNVTCDPEARRHQTNNLSLVTTGRARLVSTFDVLSKHPRFPKADDLHLQPANKYRADLLLNHLAPSDCFSGHANVTR